jgi:hypothetical protein
LSNTEKADEERNVFCTHINDEFSLTVGNVKNRTKDYTFDTVFGPDSSQEAVFEDSKRLI